MTQITHTKLQELNIIELYKHYGALEHSLPLLTPESQELAKAELETCITLRSEKIDRIYYAIAANEDAVERIKKEKALILQAQKHHEGQVNSLKQLLNYLRRVLPQDQNKIVGKNYQFTMVKKKDLTVEIKSDLDSWTEEEQREFCLQEETTTTKQVVLRSMQGEILSQKVEPATKTTTLPNLDAIRNAYQRGEQLPPGVKVYQEYSVRSSRVYSKSSGVDLAPSEYPGELLPET